MTNTNSNELNKFILLPSAAFFFIQLITGSNFPVFRDEFYYLDCAAHLSFGYVDHPPFSIILLSSWIYIFGDSLISLRILPALFGSLFIFFNGVLAKELGGGRFAQLLASAAVFCAPVYWAMCSFYSMNAIDIFIWVLLFILLAKIINGGNNLLWILLGLTAGIGLMNKISIGYFGLALLFALLFTPLRKWYLKKEFWIFGAISLIIFLPYVIWNFYNDFASVEFIRNASQHKNTALPFLSFLKELFLQINPLNIFIWVTGLYAMVFGKTFQKYRLFGLIFIFVFLIVFLNYGKAYYMAASFPVLLTSGAVIISQIKLSKYFAYIKYAYVIILLISISFLLPVVIPVLSPWQTAEYVKRIGIMPSAGEKLKPALLPQTLADRFGWQEMSEIVLNIYNSLPADEQKHTAVFTQNYGEAGAIRYFGKNRIMPEIISGHNNHFLWKPVNDDINTLIIIGGKKEDHLKFFADVTEMGRTQCEFCMPYENDRPVYLARYPAQSLKSAWNKIKHYD